MHDGQYLYEAALPRGAVLHGELSAQFGRALPATALFHRLFDAVVQRFALYDINITVYLSFLQPLQFQLRLR